MVFWPILQIAGRIFLPICVPSVFVIMLDLRCYIIEFNVLQLWTTLLFWFSGIEPGKVEERFELNNEVSQSKSQTKSGTFDFLPPLSPVALLKTCHSHLLPIFTQRTNQSFTQRIKCCTHNEPTR